MKEFIKELTDLLKKHNAVILRSAGVKNELVVSFGEFKEGKLFFTDYSIKEEIYQETKIEDFEVVK